MKRILFFSIFVGLVFPSVLIAEVTRISCKTSQERIKSTRMWIDVNKAKFSEWKKIKGFVYNFEFDEKGDYVDVYFPNKSYARAGTNLATFRPDLIKFVLPVKKDLVDNTYTLDNYELNRINGDFSRIFKIFNSENNELTYEMQVKGKCKKNSNQIKLF
tara:strand:+ start:57 stop:533 length:477 start_codon:yes stop_codon:yes gene_type:complete